MLDTFVKRAVLAALVLVASAAVSCTRSDSETPVTGSGESRGTSTVALELAGPVNVAALQVDISYPQAAGRFAGDAGEVECETLIEGALSSYNHVAASQSLKAAYVAVAGIQGPVRIAECRFLGVPSATALKLKVVDASSKDLKPLSPLPELKIVVEADRQP